MELKEIEFIILVTLRNARELEKQGKRKMKDDERTMLEKLENKYKSIT